MAFYKEKGWWKSRTVWTGIVSTIIGVLVFFGVPIPIELSEQIVAGIMAITGILTVVFRAKATTALTATENTL